VRDSGIGVERSRKASLNIDRFLPSDKAGMGTLCFLRLFVVVFERSADR